MIIHKALFKAVFGLSLCVFGAQSVNAVIPKDETIQEYAAVCDSEIGVSVPAFDCEVGGTEILGQQKTDDVSGVPVNQSYGGPCANPNYLHGGAVCDPGSNLHVLHDEPQKAFIVAFCRKSGTAVNGHNFNDIAVIQHNRVNGATCFYQRDRSVAGGVSQFVSDPSDPVKGGWEKPKEIAFNLGCVGCHNNGPLIRSKYVNSIHEHNPMDPNTLPDFEDPYRVNQFNSPYWFPGKEMKLQEVSTYSISKQDNGCQGCHRLSISTYLDGPKTSSPITKLYPNNRYGSLGFGVMATNSREALNSQPEKYLSALDGNSINRWWMPPATSSYNEGSVLELNKLINCKNKFNSTVLYDSVNNPNVSMRLNPVDLFKEGNGSDCTISQHPKIINQPQGLPVGIYADENGERETPMLKNTGMFKWIRQLGDTPTVDTGPSSGAGGSGSYYYMETSVGYANSNGNTSIFETDFFDPTRTVLTFDYHMLGADIGALYVDAFIQGAWITNFWSQIGSQGNQWSNVSIDVDSIIPDGMMTKIRLRAVAKGGDKGDIAIDNIKIKTLPAPKRVVVDDNAESATTTLLNTGSPANIHWLRNTGGTPTNSTGPSAAAGGSYYYYLETSVGYANTKDNYGSLAVADFDFENMVLSFDYHMYGSNIGELLVEYRISNYWITVPLWSKKGNQGNQWQKAVIDLTGIDSTTKVGVRLRAVAAGGQYGDIAVDNILIKEK